MKKKITRETLRKWLAEMFPQQENLNDLLAKWLDLLPYHIVAIIISRVHDQYITTPGWDKTIEYLSAIIYEHYREYVETGNIDARGYPLGRPRPFWWKKFTLRKL